MKVPQSQPHSVQQHCPFTQSASPSADQSSATELQDTCWPALPDLHSGQEMFDADLPAPTLDDLCLPGLLRTSSFPNQAVHATDILSAEQLDGSWDHTGLPNLSTFADMDFDEMIAQAADELHSAQQQQRQQHQHQQHLYHHQQHQQQHYQQHQQQHHGSLSPDNDCNEDALQGKVPRRAARSCPASPAMSPQVCLMSWNCVILWPFWYRKCCADCALWCCSFADLGVTCLLQPSGFDLTQCSPAKHSRVKWTPPPASRWASM